MSYRAPSTKSGGGGGPRRETSGYGGGDEYDAEYDDAVSDDPHADEDGAGEEFDDEAKKGWKIGLCSTVSSHCGDVVYHCLCGPCTTCTHRDLLVGNNDYYCCGRAIPCCCFANPCPHSCLYCEVMCCPVMAVMVNRIMLEDRYNLKETPCSISLCACLLCCCMHSQHGVEMDDTFENAPEAEAMH